MSNYTPEQPGFESEDIISRIEADNEILIQRKFLEDLRIFKADFFLKLASHDAIHNGNGCAIFRWRLAEGDGNGMYRETLLLSTRVEADAGKPTPVPKTQLRILVNEPVATEEGHQWLTFDFCADEDDDTQYFIDAVNQNTQKLRTTNSPLFHINEEEKTVSIDNLRSYTPVAIVRDEDSSLFEVLPFGYFNRLGDRITALEIGKQLLQETFEHDPLITPRHVTIKKQQTE